jgi:hypothetical protein
VGCVGCDVVVVCDIWCAEPHPLQSASADKERTRTKYLAGFMGL